MRNSFSAIHATVKQHAHGALILIVDRRQVFTQVFQHRLEAVGKGLDLFR